MKMPRRRALFACSVLVVALVLFMVLRPTDFGRVDLPSPNGYDDFLSAAYALRGEAVDYESELALQALVLTNSEAYVLVRAGLNKRCLVPIRIDRNYPAAHRADLGRLKRLTHCMVAREELARMQGRSMDAAEEYREAYAFACRVGQGGLGVDFLVQIACKAVVLHHFGDLIPDLTPVQCSQMLSALEQAEEGTEDWRAIMSRQSRWERAVFSPRERAMHWGSRVATAIRERSWLGLRSFGDQVQAAATHHREQDVLPVLNLLQARSVAPDEL